MDESLVLVKDIVGYISVALLSILYIPQVWHVYRNLENIKGMSYFFLVIGGVLTVDMIVYGALLHELPLIIANSIVFVCLIILLVAKIIWDKSIRDGKEEEPSKI